MYHYKVTFFAGTEDGLSLINLGDDGYSEIDYVEDNGDEVYDVYSEYDIDRQLDLRDQVKSYTVEKYEF